MILLIMTFLLLFSLAGCRGKTVSKGTQGSDTANDTVVRVGSKDFTENLIVAELYALALEDAGYKVERVMNIAGSLVHASILNNEIDLYPEYTGTGLITILGKSPMTDEDEVYQTVKEEYEKQFDLVWLDYAKANDSQGIFISKRASDRYGINTISDLQKNAYELRFASQGEFDEREDGMPGLEKVYGALHGNHRQFMITVSNTRSLIMTRPMQHLPIPRKVCW